MVEGNGLSCNSLSNTEEGHCHIALAEARMMRHGAIKNNRFVVSKHVLALVVNRNSKVSKSPVLFDNLFFPPRTRLDELGSTRCLLDSGLLLRGPSDRGLVVKVQQKASDRSTYKQISSTEELTSSSCSLMARTECAQQGLKTGILGMLLVSPLLLPFGFFLVSQFSS